MINFAELASKVKAALGVKDLPKKDGKLNLSEEQKATLNDAVKDVPDFADKFEQRANLEFEKEQELSDKTAELEAARQELKSFMDENEIETTGSEQTDKNNEKKDPNLAAMISAVKEKISSLEEQVRLLGDQEESEPSAVENFKTKGMKIVHSATHLFASGQSYDSYEGRPWNKRAMEMANNPGKYKGNSVSATDWTGVNIDRVNQDLDDFWRVNSSEVINSIALDYRGIPAHWFVVNNIDDEIGYAAILTGEVTQGRKKKWLPKNMQELVPLKGKVYPIQIDLEWEGYELQKIETSWLNRFNKEGSSPFKMSFVQFLVTEIMKQQNQEDAISLVKGVYYPNVDRDKPQSFMFNINGFLKLVSQNINKAYKPFTNLGKPTPVNIVDYVKRFCEALPDEKRTMPNLYFTLSPTWLRRYNDRRKQEDGANTDYDPSTSTVEGFPNIRLTTLDYLDGSDFMYLTHGDNIGILQNVSRENSLLTFDREKRNIIAFGDYKLGAHVEVFGAQWNGQPPKDYNHQVFWSNDVELLTDVAIPVAENVTELNAENHYAIRTGENTQATAITNILNAVNGKYYYIYGNKGANASTIANAGNFDLTASITLDENTMIKLFKRPADGKFVEIMRRTDLDKTDQPVVIDADATTIDGSLGTYFLTSANTQATAITDIENAEDMEVYTIEGGSAANASTIAKAGKFSRITGAITLSEGNWIKVQYSAGKFIELERYVAA